MRKQVEAWLSQAFIDLKTAERIVGDDELTPSTAFHCQQCVEKCMKALIENENDRVPKTHNLPRLLGIDKARSFLQFARQLYDRELVPHRASRCSHTQHTMNSGLTRFSLLYRRGLRVAYSKTCLPTHEQIA